MCMCIEFVSQVLKQKNAHVSFPFGMVLPYLTPCILDHLTSSTSCYLKIILTTATPPQICKNYATEICHTIEVCMA